jgi:hypothetical protein
MSLVGKLSVAILVFFSSVAHSLAIEPSEVNCSDGDTFCAASCALSDVQAAADLAMASGLADTTIYIPA